MILVLGYTPVQEIEHAILNDITQTIVCEEYAQEIIKKMEDAIKKIDGVNDASVSFMTQKMMIDADDERFDDIVKEAVAVCKKVEPECVIHL